MCGQAKGDLDPYDRKPVGIEVAFFIPREYGGRISPNNLRSICSTCKEGLDGIPYNERPSTLRQSMRLNPETLYMQVRRATGKDQLELLKWLMGKFPEQSAEILKEGTLDTQ